MDQMKPTERQMFQSWFRIDGKPIISPLMTADKYKQMQQFKEKAMQLEANLRNKQKRNQYCDKTSAASTSPSSIDNRAQKQNEFEETCRHLTNVMHEMGNDDEETISLSTMEQNEKQSTFELHKSKTLIFDNAASSVFELGQSKHTSPTHSKSLVKPMENAAFQMIKHNESQLEELLIYNKKIPEICINPPTPIILKCVSSEVSGSSEDDIVSIKSSKEQFDAINISSCEFKRSPIRSYTHPYLNLEQEDSNISSLNVSNITDGSTLVRSNSFTLDCPSKALLDHLQQQNENAFDGKCTSGKRILPSPRTRRDTVESKAKRVQKVELKPRSSPLKLSQPRSSTKRQLTKTGASVHASKQGSPLENTKHCLYKFSNVSGKSKEARKSCSKSIAPAFPGKTLLTTPKTPNSVSSNVDAFFGQLNEEHRRKIMHLITQQLEAQRRLQQTFEDEQNSLFKILTCETQRTQIDSSCSSFLFSPTQTIDESQTSSPTSMHLTSSICSSAPGIDVAVSNYDIALDLISITESKNSSRTDTKRSHNTPRRRLFPNEVTVAESNKFGRETLKEKNKDIQIPSATNSKAGSLGQLSQAQRNAAATIINAHARGFLVRRLFQTEQIQRIVQTIRDTLIFVLNLHVETIESLEEDAPENIQLKARLLQQLSSASRSLHLVLFQTTVKERMDIIAQDRKRIKSKLLTMRMKR